MIGLGLVLAILGVFAAWNIKIQQRLTADSIVQEVHGLATTTRLHFAIREIRYQLNLYLRTKSPQSLKQVRKSLVECSPLLDKSLELASSQREVEMLGRAAKGYKDFAAEFSATDERDINEEKVLHLIDDLLTERVLQPLNMCLEENEEVVERTYLLGQSSSKQLGNGLLLLGVTGGVAGILMGLAVARGIGRSIVQLNVSVQSVAKSISQGKSKISFTHVGDIGGIESNLRSLETDIEHVVETLQQREYELLRSEQLARVGHMAAGLAHELRNPLMPMKMLVQAALQSDGGGRLSQRSLQILNDEILRLEETIQSFLDFARPRIPVRLDLDVCDFLRSSASFVADKARSLHIEIVLNIPTTPVIAQLDQNQLKQLFLNLVNNAMDAMGDGGVLEILLETIDYNAQDQTFPNQKHDRILDTTGSIVSRSEKWIVISFRDTGTGLSADVMDTLFEPFVTTKETGTGLGLSICQQIATAHGGVLRANNRLDRTGAEFKLILPQTT